MKDRVECRATSQRTRRLRYYLLGLFAILLLLLSGCAFRGVFEMNGGYSLGLTKSAPRHNGIFNMRVASGWKGIPVLIDMPLARFRFNKDRGRLALGGVGAYFWVGNANYVFAPSAGVSLIDSTWGDEGGGFGMFSPYVEVAGIFRITENMALSPFVGIEYETRFKGPRGGFYVNFGIGILYSVGDWFTRR